MPRPIILTEDMKQTVRDEFEKTLTNAKMSDGKFNYSKSFKYENKKARVMLSHTAYTKILALVTDFTDEVGWHGSVIRNNDDFIIEDIFVYPQEVTGATVNTDQELYTDWLYELDDEVFDKLRMHGHSHCNMSVSPSGVDSHHREQIIEQLDGDMFYIFMIWNKSLCVHSEVALLNELKSIVLDFIEQIKAADFGSGDDVKRLYEKASEIETRLVNVDYKGNTADVNRLVEVTNTLRGTPEVHVVRIPSFRAVSSGYDTFENIFAPQGFEKWINSRQHLLKNIIFDCPDFMWHENGKTIWIWAIKDDVTTDEMQPYEVIGFEGGLYATAVSIDGDDDIGGRVYGGIQKWLQTSGFELDVRPGHQTLCNMIYPDDDIKQALGYHQLEIYIPIKVKEY